MLKDRGFALESAVARICREAGGRVAANLLVRNMDLGLPRAGDNRCLEVVVDGLPLYGGAQLLHSRAMESQGEEPQTVTAWPLQQLTETRKEHTLSWLDLAHDWWFSFWKWAAGGPRKPKSLSVVGKGSGQIKTTTDATSR